MCHALSWILVRRVGLTSDSAVPFRVPATWHISHFCLTHKTLPCSGSNQQRRRTLSGAEHLSKAEVLQQDVFRV